MGDKSRKIIEKEYCTNTINANLCVSLRYEFWQIMNYHYGQESGENESERPI